MKIKPRSKPFHLSLGDRGEMIAAAYLTDKKYTILDKKFRSALGELDIVARIQTTLVFVEVKTRSSARAGLPEEAVDFAKQKQMTRLALSYVQKNNLSKMKTRFDVIAILYDGIQAPQIRHIENAFDAAEEF